MSTLKSTIRRFIREVSGATMVEYGIMVALIAVVAIAAVRTLGTSVNGGFTNINTNLAS